MTKYTCVWLLATVERYCCRYNGTSNRGRLWWTESVWVWYGGEWKWWWCGWWRCEWLVGHEMSCSVHSLVGWDVVPQRRHFTHSAWPVTGTCNQSSNMKYPCSLSVLEIVSLNCCVFLIINNYLFLVLCEYSKFRMESNGIVTSVFQSIRNEHNYSKFSNTYCHQFLTYLTEWRRFFTLATTPSIGPLWPTKYWNSYNHIGAVP